jgi:hypothetical protein
VELGGGPDGGVLQRDKIARHGVKLLPARAATGDTGVM